MTQKENVLVTLIEQIQSTPVAITYSPIQDGDTVLGTASEFALKALTLANRLKGALAVAKARIGFETDGDVRNDLIEEAIAIQIKLMGLDSIVEAQLRSDVKNWNRPLVIRDGGKVVVTPTDERFGAQQVQRTNEAIQQAIEAQNYGEPPTARSRVMQFDLSQLGDILGEGGLEAIFGASSPFENGDGRTRHSAL